MIWLYTIVVDPDPPFTNISKPFPIWHKFRTIDKFLTGTNLLLKYLFGWTMAADCPQVRYYKILWFTVRYYPTRILNVE